MLIDRNAGYYDFALLQEWKTTAERLTHEELEGKATVKYINDIEELACTAMDASLTEGWPSNWDGKPVVYIQVIPIATFRCRVRWEASSILKTHGLPPLGGVGYGGGKPTDYGVILRSPHNDPTSITTINKRGWCTGACTEMFYDAGPNARACDLVSLVRAADEWIDKAATMYLNFGVTGHIAIRIGAKNVAGVICPRESSSAYFPKKLSKSCLNTEVYLLTIPFADRSGGLRANRKDLVDNLWQWFEIPVEQKVV